MKVEENSMENLSKKIAKSLLEIEAVFLKPEGLTAITKTRYSPFLLPGY